MDSVRKHSYENVATTKFIKMKKLDWYIKWAATAFICAGALCTSLNIYPLGPILLNIGTVLWLIVSIMWREASLIAVNAIVLVIYTTGLVVKLWL
jgi:hypothetical protein